MAKVRKLNRMLTVSDEAVAVYLKEGYDQVDEKGKIVKRATGGKTISLAEHNKALDKIEKLVGDGGFESFQKEIAELKKENSALKGKITKLENAAKGQAEDKNEDKK